MDVLTINLTGIGGGLLMHSDQGLDPLNPLVREMKSITSKGSRAKTEEDIIEIQRLEFLLGLYFDPELGPYLPAAMIEAAIRDGAKGRKLGKETTRSIMVVEDKIALDYRGPRTTKGLWDRRFFDSRSVKVGQSRVIRTRPYFSEWAATFSLQYDGEYMDADVVQWCIRNAGARVGLGDYRPRFGRFEATFA